MDIAYHPNEELADIRSEIKRLKAREQSLSGSFLGRRDKPAEPNDDTSVERQLRQVFRQNRLSDVVGL